jgi:hypothetical protein
MSLLCFTGAYRLGAAACLSIVEGLEGDVMRQSRSRSGGVSRRRLVAWFAAVLTVVAIGEARSASAGVIYVDVDPDHVWFKLYLLDADGDGTPDLSFDQDFGCLGNCTSTAMLGALNGDVLMSDAENVAAMSAGVIVGPAASTWGAGNRLAFDRYFGDPPTYLEELGEWDNGLTAFAGFRFLNASGVHYGWVRLLVEETSNQITIFDYAYDDTPNTAIAAGAGAPAVPEPATMALVLIGACGVAARRRRLPAA